MSGRKKQRIYWDSCAFIAIFSNESDKVDICSSIFRDAQVGKIELFTSTLAIVECTGGAAELSKMTENAFAERQRLIRSFFRHRCLHFVQMDRRLMEEAASLAQWRRRNGGTIPNTDAIHLASALHAQADVLQTYDTRHLLALHDTPLPGYPNSLKIQPPSNIWNVSLGGEFSS